MPHVRALVLGANVGEKVTILRCRAGFAASTSRNRLISSPSVVIAASPPASSPHDAILFLEKLEQARRRFALRVYGYVVMPEHIHLLVSEPVRGLLSTALQSLKLAVAKRVPALGMESDEPAQLWQKRYYDRNVRDSDGFIEKLRYIHRNPVKRGLVERPEDWPWSSFRHYAEGEAGVVEIESEWTARRRERLAAASEDSNPR